MKWLLFLGVFVSLHAQNKQLLYGFKEVPQQILLNPGDQVDHRGYIGVPLLSHIYFNAGITGFSAFDVFADDGKDFNQKIRDVVYKMDAKDFFEFNQQLEFFSAGLRVQTSFEKFVFISFGMYQESDLFSYFPEDLAVLAYEGNHNNLNRSFYLGHLNASAEALSVFHLGINKKLNPKWTVGIRGKIYSSIAQASSTENKGSFRTVRRADNSLTHIFDLDMKLQTSGLSFLDEPNASDGLGILQKRLLFGGNLGFGIDLGFTYQPSPEWTVDASLQDIGFINYSKDVKNYILDGYLEYEGIQALFPELVTDQMAQGYWDEVSKVFDELFEIENTTTSYTKWRPIKLNSSVSYNFGRKIDNECNCLDKSDPTFQSRVGAHLFAMKRPKHLQWALSAFYYRKLFKGLQLKTTYTVDAYSFKNVGLGMSASVGAVQFYVMADNLLDYQNLAKSQSVSLQLGFNYIFKNNEN
tara:strand:- start:467 stop:1870 length:1404 start_codon:yes stop_codon:yes gene_type:complete